ncbi:MAG: sialidase family protein [Anaerolineae bacterium]
MSGNYLKGTSDAFVGQRRRLARYLVCALEGYFPVLVQTGPDSLAVIYRSGATHVGVAGTLSTCVSEDGGKSWSDGIRVTPRWNDDRNPALGVNKSGNLVAAFWRARLQSYQETPEGSGLVYKGPTTETLQVPATFTTVSSDSGRTWSEPQLYYSELLALASPFGRIITLSDGTLLMCLYGQPRKVREGSRDITIVCRSRDGGMHWGEESLIAEGHNETSLLALPDGTLLAASRSESGHIAVLDSSDLGYTWSFPRQVTRDGEHPADLTLLQSGKVLLTFGRRIRPLGAGLLLSSDNGRSFDRESEVLLAGDGINNGDLGYPSTVQLADSHLVTVLYYASGSEMSQQFGGWGDVSCQAIHYREEDIRP